jgi:hypothetical protein
MNSTELIGRARDRWNEIDHEGLDWFSFFNGWLEGRADIVYPKKEADDYSTEGNAFPSVTLNNTQTANNKP